MSNIVILSDAGCPVTTSLAIAEGVGNPHSSVIKLIRQNASDLEEFGNIGFEIQNSTSGAGRPTEYAILNEQQSTLLLTYMRNNDVVRFFKKRLVKAFFDLAKGKQQVDESPELMMAHGLIAAQQLLEDKQKQIEEQRDVIKALEPKAEALDRIATADGSLCITNAAKDLQVRPKDLFGYLSRSKWIYKRPGNASWTAYQDKLQQGLLEHKTTEVTRTDGSSKVTEQVRVTPKGLAKLARLIAEGDVA